MTKVTEGRKGKGVGTKVNSIKVLDKYNHLLHYKSLINIQDIRTNVNLYVE